MCNTELGETVNVDIPCCSLAQKCLLEACGSVHAGEFVSAIFVSLIGEHRPY